MAPKKRPTARNPAALKRPAAAKPAARGRPKAKAHAAEKPRAKIDRTRIYAVVPARSGSKGVIGKNIKDFCGKPLMAWQIDNGLKSKYVSRVFVSTDSEEYKAIAEQWGAEVPFLRPAEIAHSTATDYQFFDHFLRWMKENDPDRQPSLLVQLRPTAPCLDAETVDACIETFLKHEDGNFDSLRTVTPIDHEAFNQYFTDPHEPHRLVPVVPESYNKDDPSQVIPEPQSVARQILPQIYWHNAYLDIVRPETILEQKCVMGKRCLSFHMGAEHNADIDTPEQWATAEVKKRAQLAAAEEAAQRAAAEEAAKQDHPGVEAAAPAGAAPAAAEEPGGAPDAEMGDAA